MTDNVLYTKDAVALSAIDNRFTGSTYCVAGNFKQCAAIAMYGTSSLYVADYAGNRVVKIADYTGPATSAVITVLAGGGVCQAGNSGDDGVGSSALLNEPRGVAVDSVGRVYVSDSVNNRIRRVYLVSGVNKIYHFAGNAAGTGGTGGDGGPATAAYFNQPKRISIDAADNLYVADYGNHLIRKISIATGIVTNIAGAAGVAFSGLDGGPVSLTMLNNPWAVTPDVSGNLFITDGDSSVVRRIRNYVAAGSVDPFPYATGAFLTTYAGRWSKSSVNAAFGGSLYDGSPATDSGLQNPRGVVLNARGDLFIADALDHLIRKVDVHTGIITSIVGTGVAGNGGDVLMLGTACAINTPPYLAIDRSGNIYITDNKNNKIRVWYASTALVKTYAGTGTAGSTGDGGPATSALLNNPYGVALDSSQNLFIADYNNFCVRRVAFATGIITTVAGTNGAAGTTGDGGYATSAKLLSAVYVAFDSSSNLYIADNLNHKIRMVSNFVFGANNVIRTLAGTGVAGFTGDGGLPASALLNGPRAVAIDADDNIFIADTGNNRIRRINRLSGLMGLVAGSSLGYDGDGYYKRATLAKLNFPASMAIDATGGIYIGDYNNHVVRYLSGALTDPDPTSQPTSEPTNQPSSQPTIEPSRQPSSQVRLSCLTPPLSTPRPTPLYSIYAFPYPSHSTRYASP
jgi:sugar lactone lactonase YvrE